MSRPSFSTRPGFTILELLIVIAVFGLLVTLGVLSISGARARARDAQRLSDVSILRGVLSQHWLEKAMYPKSDGVDLGQSGTGTDVFTSEGFQPKDQAKGTLHLQTIPVGPNVNEFYRYKGSDAGYSIRFQTESDTVLGKANVFYAHASGIDGKDELK